MFCEIEPQTWTWMLHFLLNLSGRMLPYSPVTVSRFLPMFTLWFSFCRQLSLLFHFTEISSKLSCTWFRTVLKPVQATPQLRKQKGDSLPLCHIICCTWVQRRDAVISGRLSSLCSPTVLFLLSSPGITWSTSVMLASDRPFQDQYSHDSCRLSGRHWQHSLCYRCSSLYLSHCFGSRESTS